jgi:RNA polymerase sigma-70 factor (ECF subfamily)
MLSRVWTGTVSPEWKVRVTGADSLPAADPTWAAADDRMLVEACLAGRRDAFDPIVERHRRQIYLLCYRYVGNHEDASDLAQDVFIRAYRGLGGFKGNSSFSTWLYRIGVNVCLNHLSLKTPHSQSLDERTPLASPGERADAAVLRLERAGEVRAAIAKLPPRQRATLILRVYHELAHDEIASILGSSVGAVKANFFHALANLKKLLK